MRSQTSWRRAFRIERRADGAATVSYEHSELGVLYPERGVAELPVLERDHDVLIEHGDAGPTEQAVGSASVSSVAPRASLGCPSCSDAAVVAHKSSKRPISA